MEFLKKSIHMDQIGCEEQTQITLEDDINIADAKPDVYQVVTQQGHVELEEVRASDGHVHVKGVLHFKVLISQMRKRTIRRAWRGSWRLRNRF